MILNIFGTDYATSVAQSRRMCIQALTSAFGRTWEMNLGYGGKILVTEIIPVTLRYVS